LLTCPGTSANVGETAPGEVDMADEEGGRWISSQCDYFLGRETDCRRFWCVSIQMPCYYSNHRALVTVIYAEGGGGENNRIKSGHKDYPAPNPGAPQRRFVGRARNTRGI
jgi:hypothetical protein